MFCDRRLFAAHCFIWSCTAHVSNVETKAWPTGPWSSHVIPGQAAVALYTQALVWAPTSETLLSNRSAAYAAAGQFKAALEDAVK